jgi:chromosome segregation protein
VSRLKELRLHGFKTFAEPTRFVFEAGVNAVIGPNGSGKSNMADAVRWVLGEQSNRSLRTRRADDVIFAGSQHRKPQGMAEAILTLDNADGWLPIEFSEVTIGRRAYRSGESEYLINGARARLRDVVELLGEGRLGASELVVVGQGTVDAALSLRPDERRQLFEEAAGVKNLQVRKNEALARLVKARDNRVRLDDLIGELRPQVRRLSLQAQHQQEHDELGRRARRLVVESHRRREGGGRQALGDARRRAAAAEAALAKLRDQEAAGRRALAAAEERYWQAEAAARSAAERREATREALIRTEAQAGGLRARASELETAITAAESELASVEQRLRRGPVADETHPVLAAAAEAEGRWREACDALAASDAALLAAEETLAEARRRRSERVAREAHRGEVAARAQARREQLDADLAAARSSLDDAEQRLGPLATRLREAEATTQEAHRNLDTAVAELAAAQPRADSTRRRSAELAERVGSMRGELAALTDRAERGSRLGAELAAAGWPSLLDALVVPEEAWPAIEAVVGGELEHALVWREMDLADRLARVDGTARLLTIDKEQAINGGAERDRALAAVAGSRTLADWLGQAGAPRIFHRTAVAADVSALLRGWHDLPSGWLAVTAEGDLADGRGLVSVRGRARGVHREAARRNQQRRELAARLDDLEAEQAEAAAEAGRAMGAVGDAGRKVEAHRTALEAAERKARALRLEHDGLAHQRDEAGARIQAIRVEMRGLADVGSSSASSERNGPPPRSPDLAALERAATEARERRARQAQVREEARIAWRAARAAADAEEERSVHRRRDLIVAEARQAQISDALPAQRAALGSARSELTRVEAELAAARDLDAAAASGRQEAEAERDRARAELLELERGEVGSSVRLAELEREASAATGAAIRLEEVLAGLARERDLALESLPLAGEHGTAGGADGEETTDGSAGEIRALNDEELESELRRIRRTLAQIGSVNPFAVEEHREQAARLDEMTAQEADLGHAIASIEELIGRLEAEITERFNAAFLAIGERFDEFCRLLFAGGSASLQLSPPEDGEAPGGIEIVVRPPGKRQQRLAMLSGGERALTGVALLFAMLSVNPVPFCILDEVDAALDEANIGRFADALRTLAEQIDFVVITHNRATIEIADTIYGVTMTDAAVSRVVGLRLADLPAEAMVG